jgi:hypothetical protein
MHCSAGEQVVRLLGGDREKSLYGTLKSAA